MVSEKTRARIEMQGFVGLSDQTLTEIDPWLRLAPFLCAVWAGVGTALESPEILWALAPIAAAGAILPGHPFDAIYNWGVRHALGTAPLPPYRAPRRFGCVIATLWLLATGWSFQTDAVAVGRALGATMVLLPMVQVTTGFCVPSFVYGLAFGRRQAPASAVVGRSR